MALPKSVPRRSPKLKRAQHILPILTMRFDPSHIMFLKKMENVEGGGGCGRAWLWLCLGPSC